MNTKYTHSYVETNAAKLHVTQAGSEDGPLVILLHGFPEFCMLSIDQWPRTDWASSFTRGSRLLM